MICSLSTCVRFCFILHWCTLPYPVLLLLFVSHLLLHLFGIVYYPSLIASLTQSFFLKWSRVQKLGRSWMARSGLVRKHPLIQVICKLFHKLLFVFMHLKALQAASKWCTLTLCRMPWTCSYFFTLIYVAYSSDRYWMIQNMKRCERASAQKVST